MPKFDVAIAYLYIPIAKLSYWYLHFMQNGQVLQFIALPFGLASADLDELLLSPLSIGLCTHPYMED